MSESEKEAIKKEAYVAVLLWQGDDACTHPMDSEERAYWLQVYRAEHFSLEGA